MGVTKQSYALSLTACVLVTAAAVGMLVFAYASPTSNIRTFLVTRGVVMIGVVVLIIVGIVKQESDKKDQHDKLKMLNPKFCPDYWTNGYDSCSGATCTPTFQEADGKVVMSGAFSMQGTPIGQVKDMNSEGVCESRSTRLYPWVEVDNSCDARERRF